MDPLVEIQQNKSEKIMYRASAAIEALERGDTRTAKTELEIIKRLAKSNAGFDS